MRILDIGVGFGRWGILFREFLEVWESNKYKGNWERTIDGVEIYPGYIRNYHKYFYDNIFIEDALTFIKTTNKKYDLINCGDIIEHFSKEDGKIFIDSALEKGKCLLINVPIGKYWGQISDTENIYETHKSIWHNSDFTKYKYCKIKRFKDFVQRDFSVILLSKQKLVFQKRFGKYFHIKNFLKHRVGIKKIIENYELQKSR